MRENPKALACACGNKRRVATIGSIVVGGQSLDDWPDVRESRLLLLLLRDLSLRLPGEAWDSV